MISKENILFIVNILKAIRPKFYDKVTWLIICAGLSLMTTSLFQKLLEIIFEVSFEINITGSNDTVWGFSLVCLGLIYNLVNSGLYELLNSTINKEAFEKQISHDKEIFSKAINIMQEEDLLDLLQWLRDDHSFYMSRSRRLEQFCDFLSKNQNKFIAKDINDLVKELSSSSYELINFISNRFHIYPDHQTGEDFRLCMEPALNIDRDGTGKPEEFDMYAELTRNLDNYINTVYTKYSVLRKQIKEKYFI